MPVLSGVSLTVGRGRRCRSSGPPAPARASCSRPRTGCSCPTAGDVRIDGHSVYGSRARAPCRQIRRKVGYVFQYAALFDSMNVFENVVIGLPDGEAKRARSPEVLRERVRRARGREPGPRPHPLEGPLGALGRNAQARGPRPGHRGPARDPALRRAGDRPRPGQHRHDLAADPGDPRAHSRDVDRGDPRHRAGPGDLRPGRPAHPRQAALRGDARRVPCQRGPRGPRLRRPPRRGGGRRADGREEAEEVEEEQP